MLTEGRLLASDIKTDGNATRITLAPVALEANREYAIVVLTDDANHAVSVAELGKYDPRTGHVDRVEKKSVYGIGPKNAEQTLAMPSRKLVDALRDRSSRLHWRQFGSIDAVRRPLAVLAATHFSDQQAPTASTSTPPSCCPSWRCGASSRASRCRPFPTVWPCSPGTTAIR